LKQIKFLKSKETKFYDRLDASLSVDQHLINQGLPIFKMSKILNEKNEGPPPESGLESALIGSPVRVESPKMEPPRNDDLMFQTEIDPEPYQ